MNPLVFRDLEVSSILKGFCLEPGCVSVRLQFHNDAKTMSLYHPPLWVFLQLLLVGVSDNRPRQVLVSISLPCE